MNKQNTTLTLINEHSSTRAFKKDLLTAEEITFIIEAAQRAPSSFNGQQVSIVVTQESETKKRISEFAGGQPWIADAPLFLTFVMDYTKPANALKLEGHEQLIHRDIEGILAASIDSGIALSTAMLAARSLGLGAVPIGGIRGNPEEMIKLLNLPPLTFPLVGLAIGKVAKASELKPRLPLETFAHHEKFDGSKLNESIVKYNQILIEHWKKINRKDGQEWSKSLAPYSRVYFPKVAGALIKQGFSWQVS